MSPLPPLLAALLLSAASPACLGDSQAHSWDAAEIHSLTEERLLSLPATERASWQAYLSRSKELEASLAGASKDDFTPDKPVAPQPKKKGAAVSKGLRLSETSEWYASPTVQAIADHVVGAQNPAGGWSKGNSYSDGPVPPPQKRTIWDNGTFDNNAVVHELVFLARVITAAPDSAPGKAAWRGAFDRGLAYVFSAQYPNGGFPQIYPLGGGYHDAITFNDDALLNILRLLAGVASREGPYRFAGEAQAEEAGRRLALGISCVLDCQIQEDGGRLTVWNQQHDMLTLKPAYGRNFEPAAACASESASLVMFLMEQKDPTPEVIRSVKAAVAWFEKVALKDLSLPNGGKDHTPVPTPGAPLLWARFYELGTDRPLFGDRDRSLHYSLDEISPERRQGYAWYGSWGNKVLERHKKWLAKLPSGKK